MISRQDREAAAEVLRRLLAAVEAGEVTDQGARSLVRRLEGAVAALDHADGQDRERS